MAGVKIFKNARVFSAEAPTFADNFSDCLVISNEKIVYVGTYTDETVQSAKDDGAQEIDLSGRVVVPGFIDSHMHLLLFGLGIRKLDLSTCQNLDEIRNAISAYAKEHPEMPRVLCRQWFQSATKRQALVRMLDDLDPRPIYIEARDCHSTWCNTAALNEIRDQVEASASRYGDDIHRDANGNLDGLIAENAHFGIIWPYLMTSCSMEEKLTALKDAMSAYIQSGYTGVIDMAMDTNAWEALQILQKENGIPVHIAAHWAVHYSADESKIDERLNEAIAMNREFSPTSSPELCVVGIKLFNDGAIGGCTAAISHPYADSNDLIEPFWPADALNKVVRKAVEAGLQIAVHAIGDVAISQAVDAIAAANSPKGRHRIEHLQLASKEDVERIGRLGITASVQGVHMDPTISTAYSRIVQPHLWERAFAFKDFWDHHACVALGTDTPTAKHLPFPNLYNITTRRSANQPSLQTVVHEQYALSLSQAIAAQTAQAAYSRFAETWAGSLTAGKKANFLVLEMEWEAEKLLEAKVLQTWIKGQKLYDGASQ